MDDNFARIYLLQEGVAPNPSIGPRSGDEPAIVILQLLRPVPPLNGGDKASWRVCDINLVVFATGGPQDGTAHWVIEDPECKFAMVIIDLAHSCGLVKVYGQQISVMSLITNTTTQDQ